MARKQNARRQRSGKPHIEHYKDGGIWARGNMIDGEPTGYWEWFRTDGTKMGSGYYDRGRQVGQWITYDKQGRKHKVTNIKPASK
jgi:antitoxin component YwqK of YwqJK toxin-antitoxin module